MRFPAFLALAGLAAVIGCDSSASSSSGTSKPIASVLQTARQEGRPVFLNFGGDW